MDKVLLEKSFSETHFVIADQPGISRRCYTISNFILVLKNTAKITLKKTTFVWKF